MFVTEVGEVFSNKRGEKLADGVEQANRAVSFGDVVMRLVWFSKDYCGGPEPSLVVCFVFENAPENEIKVIDEEVSTSDKNNIGNSIGAWSFVGAEL